MTASYDQRYLITPTPPIVYDELAHIGAGLRFAQSPTNFLSDMRREYGDTFLVDVFGYTLFCVFSPEGLKSLYALAEDEASFGMATFDMLRFKTPLGIFVDADIDLFYELLVPDKVAVYVKDFADVVAQVIAGWGAVGQVNVFDEMRTLEQRVGFKVWTGEEAAQDGLWQQFKKHFDVLSQENAFVSPQLTMETLTTGKAKEKQAAAQIMALVGNILAHRQAQDAWPDDTLTFLYHRFKSEDPQVTLRKLTHNLINANQGFLSNLYAALSWTLINLKQHPQTQARLEAEIARTKAQFGEYFYESQAALDTMRFCEQLLMESVRLAQRSITLRKVMQEIQFDCGDAVYTIQPGVYITTMLSVTNTQTPELAQFDPDHYQGRKIDPKLIEQGREAVSTFGHGLHACPAQKFSHNMCKVLLTLLLDNFDFSAVEGVTEPCSSQMGGVARAAGEVFVRFHRKQRA